jgi:acyl phosphate:glycerol-3-phosphate acyltransferase
MNSALVNYLLLIPFYILGAFPTGRIVAARHGVDITTQGSGNVGATNVGRVLGKRAGIITLLGDIAKGIIGVWLAMALGLNPNFAAVAVVLGHCFSIPLRFKDGTCLKGGKGVATALGAVVALDVIIAFVSALFFATVYFRTRLVSLASLVAVLSAPLIALALGREDYESYALMAIALVVCARHRENIRRLIEGSEPKTSFGRSQAHPGS